jgi:redox-sensitive bicupin YhaK (pirin superfamily)
MRGREKNRRLKPGKGHEEMILAIQGNFQFSGQAEGTLKQGQAVHLSGEETLFLENLTEQPAVYLLAGGHSEAGQH